MIPTISFGTLDKELNFSYSRSSGPGGQHVNKVSTKVSLRFDVMNSSLLTEEQKTTIKKKLKNRINQEGELLLQGDNSRSQAKNREDVLRNFYMLINEALKNPKKRKPTKPGRGAVEERIKKKKRDGEIKKLRGEKF